MNGKLLEENSVLILEKIGRRLPTRIRAGARSNMGLRPITEQLKMQGCSFTAGELAMKWLIRVASHTAVDRHVRALYWPS
jgi:hypothetical protein